MHMLAIVPDPVDGSSREPFDQQVEAIAAAAADEQLSVGPFWLPWRADAQGAPADADDCRGLVPGAMLFPNRLQQRPGAQVAGLLVLLVGETPGSGVHPRALERAAALLATAAPTPPLVLVPDLQTSAQQVRDVLGPLQLEEPRIAGIQTTGSGVELLGVSAKSYMHSLGVRSKELKSFMYTRADYYPRIALLVEEGHDPVDTEVMQVTYPPHVGSLRVARASAALKLRPARPSLALAEPIFGDVARSSSLPNFSPASVASHDIVFEQTAGWLRQYGPDLISVAAQSVDAQVFLIGRMRSSIPNVRFGLLSMDGLLLHPAFGPALNGTLVVTSVPFRDELDASRGTRTPRPPSPERAPTFGRSPRFVLASDYAVAVYDAVRDLLSPDYAAPPTPSSDALAVGVIAHGHFWPLQAPHDRKTLHVSGWFCSIVSLLVLVCMLHLVARVRPAWVPALGCYASACRDPRLERWRLVLLGLADCAVAAQLLSIAWLVHRIGDEHGLAFYSLLVAACAALGLYVSSLRGYAQLRIFGAVLMASLGAGTLAASCLFNSGLILEPRPNMFLARATALVGGASPLMVHWAGIACMFAFALTHCVRLQAVGGVALPGVRAPHECPISRGLPELAAFEKRLEAANDVPSGGARSAVIFVLLVAAFIFVVLAQSSLHTLPSFEYHRIGWAVLLAIVLSYVQVVATTVHMVSYFVALFRVLPALDATPLKSAFADVLPPLKRRVSQQISEGGSDRLAGPVLHALAPDRFPSLLAADAVGARFESALGLITPERRERDGQAVASFVALVLGRHVQQLFYFMTLLTIAMATFGIVGSLYVFTLQPMLSATSLALTLVIVLMGAFIYRRLERDPLLASIAKGAPAAGLRASQFARVLRYGVVPLLVVLSSSYPELTYRSLQWLKDLGVLE